MSASDVRHVRGRDQDGHEKPEAVNKNVAFAVSDSLSGVVADLFGSAGVGDALGVDDRRAGSGVVA